MDYSRRIKQAGVCISSSRYDAGELIEGFVPALLSPAVVRARRDADMAQGELADRRRKAFRPPPELHALGIGPRLPDEIAWRIEDACDDEFHLLSRTISSGHVIFHSAPYFPAFGCQSPKAAPVGSISTLNHPMSLTSDVLGNGSSERLGFLCRCFYIVYQDVGKPVVRIVRHGFPPPKKSDYLHLASERLKQVRVNLH